MRGMPTLLACLCATGVAGIALAAPPENRSSRAALDHAAFGAAGAATLPRVFEWMFATGLPDNICKRPNPVDYFPTSEPKMYMWIYISGAGVGDTLEVDYTLPSGTQDSVTFKTYDTAGNYCNTFSTPLAAYSDQDRIGDWTFQILINKTQIGTAGAVVIGPAQPRVDAVEAYANGQLAALSPGALAIIRGANLASSAYSAQGVPLPASLGGASVTINDAPAPIFHTETDALYVQVPAGIRADSAKVRVTTDQGVSNPYRMPLLTVSPALIPDDSDASLAQAFRWGSDGSFARVSADAPLQGGTRRCWSQADWAPR